MSFDCHSFAGRRTGTDCRGWFFNPHKPAKPRNAVVSALLRPLARRAIVQLTRCQ